MKHVRGWLLAICCLGMCAGSADAFGWRWHNGYYRSSYYPHWGYSSYYYSPTYWSSWYYPVSNSWTYASEPACTPTIPASVVAQPEYAQPVAAPPSTKEPPVADLKKPVVTESHFPADKKKQSMTSKSQKADCRVGFWNLTGRQIVLRVDGHGHYVGKNKAITLTVDRDFSYQIDSNTAEPVRVPENQKTWEIVIR